MSGRLKQFLMNLLVSVSIGLVIACVVILTIYIVSGVLSFFWHVLVGG